ncbi:MAG TPA: hypothetical protein VNJ71_06460 [Gemmatimonadales bacterium]|jgi:hypothetical protein|nr:hypothetical protein [Gemmatimonadales bacterium]
MTAPGPLRRRLQYPALIGAGTLLAAVGVWPRVLLPIVWNVVVPLLPASFLLAPDLWRAVCPLATVGLLTNGLAARRRLSEAGVRRATVVGLLLLAVLVPARHFLFNQDAGAFLALVGALLVVAAAGGAVFDVKAGFCNAFCPVLPVERLYGQHPLPLRRETRCLPCTACIRNGCLDLGTGAIGASGGRHQAREWLRTATGVFLTAFPGFIIGYGSQPDVSLHDAGRVYLITGAWTAASWAVLSLIALGSNLAFARAARGSAALALALYYWFAAPHVAATTGLGEALAIVIRAGGIGLASVWLSTAIRSA